MPWIGIGSAIGGIAGAGATIKAAQYNLQAQREANETNLKLAREQNQWNLDQWNRENEYNTPLAQRQRMLEAGINPMGQSFDSGNASQLTSVDLANQQPETIDAVGIGNSIHNASNLINNVVAQYFQNKKTDAETRKIGLDTKYQDMVNTNFAEDFHNRMNLMKAQTGWTNEQTWESRYTRPIRMTNLRADTAVKYADQGIKLLEQGLYSYKYENMGLLNEFQRIVNYWKNSMSEEELIGLRNGNMLTYNQARSVAELIQPQKRLMNSQADVFDSQKELNIQTHKFFAQTEAIRIQQLMAEVYSILSSSRLNDVKFVRERWEHYLKISGLDKVLDGHFKDPMEAFGALAAIAMGKANVTQLGALDKFYNNGFSSVMNPWNHENVNSPVAPSSSHQRSYVGYDWSKQ